MEIAPLEVLHHDVRAVVLEAPDVERLRDMRALEPDRGARFTQEPLDQLLVARRLREEELEGNALIELEMMRCHDDAHAAHAQHLLHAVLRREDVPLRDGSLGAGRSGHRHAHFLSFSVVFAIA